MPDRCKVCGGEFTNEDNHSDCQIQAAEMRAETFAAEAIMGMRAGTTEGWYDHEEPQEIDEFYPEEEE